MNWKKLDEKIIYNGWRGMLQKTFQLPNGKEATFDIIRTNAFVTIAAFTKDKEAILVRQYRPGPEKKLISFPEGMIEKNENPATAAQRELIEETGYQAEKFVLLKKFKSAYTTDQRICLLALNCQKISKQNLDATEFIEVLCLPIEKFRVFLTNKADDSFTNVDAGYLALDYLNLL